MYYWQPWHPGEERLSNYTDNKSRSSVHLSESPSGWRLTDRLACQCKEIGKDEDGNMLRHQKTAAKETTGILLKELAKGWVLHLRMLTSKPPHLIKCVSGRTMQPHRTQYNYRFVQFRKGARHHIQKNWRRICMLRCKCHQRTMVLCRLYYAAWDVDTIW